MDEDETSRQTDDNELESFGLWKDELFCMGMDRIERDGDWPGDEHRFSVSEEVLKFRNLFITGCRVLLPVPGCAGDD